MGAPAVVGCEMISILHALSDRILMRKKKRATVTFFAAELGGS